MRPLLDLQVENPLRLLLLKLRSFFIPFLDFWGDIASEISPSKWAAELQRWGRGVLLFFEKYALYIAAALLLALLIWLVITGLILPLLYTCGTCLYSVGSGIGRGLLCLFQGIAWVFKGIFSPTGVQMMKAPGQAGVYIVRTVFEANPAAYFIGLRALG